MKKRLLSLCLALLMALGMIVSAIPASAEKANFKDVTKGDWFYEYVNFVFERGIMKGTSNTTFGPDESMTRGQIVTILSRMSGDNVAGMASSMNFKDVNKSEYYADPIGWAVKNGIAKGMSAATFEPETPVLRQEFAAFFVRYMNYKGITIEGEGKVEP
ncbi:MAG: S-layer homology domain-containing protein, partial [Clostridia bacterium]|nr:S-layer homology domain-containing protein [Clostridia bacterium]